MNKIKWVIQNNLIKAQDIAEIKHSLEFNNIEYIPVNVIPFQDEIDFGYHTTEGINYIPYGSTKLTKLAVQLNWKGVFYNENTFNVEAWLKNRDDLLNQDFEIMTVKELDYRFKDVPELQLYFIRPYHDLKIFNACTTYVKEIRNFMKSVESGSFSFPEDTLVAIASPKHIYMESRYFVIDGKIVTGSTYRIDGRTICKRELDDKVLYEAQTFADKWLPDRTCVMDLALTKVGDEKVLKLIEINSLNSSGIYSCDINEIVTKLTDYTNKL